MNINLHIERLVLDGLPVEKSQGPLVQAAIEAELSRLLTQNGLAAHFQTGSVIPSLNANPIQLSTASDTAGVGTQIAKSIYTGIGNK